MVVLGAAYLMFGCFSEKVSFGAGFRLGRGAFVWSFCDGAKVVAAFIRPGWSVGVRGERWKGEAAGVGFSIGHAAPRLSVPPGPPPEVARQCAAWPHSPAPPAGMI